MKNQQQYKDLSLLYESIYEEGILSRAGARIAGAKAASGQYLKNIGRSVVGRSTPVGAGQAAADAKTKYAFQAAAKNLLNDLQKLGLLPKGPIPQQANQQVQTALNDIIQNMVPSQAETEPVQNTPAPAQQPIAQTPEPTVTAEPIQPATPSKPRSKKAKKVTQPQKDDGFKSVGTSGKIRKVYSQSDEELSLLPNHFQYFGN